MNRPVLQRVLEPEVMDDPAEADAYEAMDHTETLGAFVDRLAELGAFGHLLDIGTGPGHLPVMACRRLDVMGVTGVDLADSMLEKARRRVEHEGLADRITLQKADAKKLPFADGSFETVASNTILHHLPDPAVFLFEACRVLKPSGVLLIRDLRRPDTPEQLEELVRLHAGDGDRSQQKLFADSLHAAAGGTFRSGRSGRGARRTHHPGLGPTRFIADRPRMKKAGPKTGWVF